MEFLWNQYALVGGLNFLLACLVSIACFRYRGVPAAKPLIGMMASVALWALLGSLELAAVGKEAKVFWNTLLFVPVLLAPSLYLLFALSYTGKGRWLRWPLLSFLGLSCLVLWAGVATNSWHRAMWPSFVPGDGNILLYGHGSWFWLVVSFTYVLFFAASGLLLRAALLFPKGFRVQAVLVTVSSLIPFLGSFIYLSGHSPVPGLDLTPFFLAGSGALMGLGVLRLNLLDLVPVARVTVIDNMPDGLIVFDNRLRVLDHNMAAQRLCDEGLRIGMAARELPAQWQRLVELLSSPHQETAEFALAPELVLEARTTPLPVPGHSGLAHIVMLRDVTHVRMAEKDLRAANEKLRDLAVRDELTGLYNRRFLMEALEREMARARRERLPLAIAIMDMDFFKRFNDEYGHQAGDAMLRALGGFLRGRIRQEDMACRYGGEEFVLILAGASESVALQRADSIRKAFAEFSVNWKGHDLHATLSMGVACYPESAEDVNRLLSNADKALYAAKNSGRNRCVAASTVDIKPTAVQPVLAR